MRKRSFPSRLPPKPTDHATRRRMQANKSFNTGPELLLRRALWAKGVRGYRIHRRPPNVQYSADVLIARSKIAIFVNGCFWHGCKRCGKTVPRNNRSYWLAKIRRNRARDQRAKDECKRAKWLYICVRECEITSRIDHVVKLILLQLARRLSNGISRPTS